MNIKLDARDVARIAKATPPASAIPPERGLEIIGETREEVDFTVGIGTIR